METRNTIFSRISYTCRSVFWQKFAGQRLWQKFGRQHAASVFVLFELSLQILRRLPRPPVRGCRKSRGQIESLLGHQTGRKRLLSPPTYMETCLQHLVFTLLCHKVPENSLKAGECFFLTIKFGEEMNWICFDCFSYFISMGFSISDPEADTIKFGEAIVFVSAIFAYFFCREMALMPLEYL